ncbi:MAG TPA: glycine cleavage system aminomethyltransferase GcvT [Kiritimatiellia bacterium]|nr:glycine cleavage system aminomethyltransferase GcvT [Kiritimatiellia bacterium]HMP00344.1 glycine cleavage system aminomethyltransferase GcvT [Kiritimatiellia bacterium]HMP97207.1 glycine cleavage system aminomethyltransferase GcvT [Kiritimatiellia bacterium]
MKTPLYENHVALGARMAPFGGWDMPIQYEGILAEHEATRKTCGLFDICHMGEFELRGPTAEADLERLLTQSIASIAVGQCKYGFLLNDEGGVLDDLTCYRLANDHFMLVVNAATCAADASWISARLSRETEFHDISSWTGKLDIQGPTSRTALEDALEMPLPDLKYFHFARIPALGHSCLLSRTGYTGEWGYEIYLPMEATQALWELLLGKGAMKPIGLGARDTLRLEVGYPLYGHELSVERTPVAAFGKNFISLEKDFIGRPAVEHELRKGAAERLVGLNLTTKRAARAGDPIMLDDRQVGVVTSGSLAPSLGHAVAIAYVAREVAESPAPLEIAVKGGRLSATITPLPFYRQGTVRGKNRPA